MKKSASEAMQLVKKQETSGNSEMSDLREENEKLTQQIEDLNLQLLQQHIAKSKDFQKNPEEESLASEIGMLEVDEITMKVFFCLCCLLRLFSPIMTSFCINDVILFCTEFSLNL